FQHLFVHCTKLNKQVNQSTSTNSSVLLIVHPFECRIGLTIDSNLLQVYNNLKSSHNRYVDHRSSHFPNQLNRDAHLLTLKNYYDSSPRGKLIGDLALYEVDFFSNKITPFVLLGDRSSCSLLIGV